MNYPLSPSQVHEIIAFAQVQKSQKIKLLILLAFQTYINFCTGVRCVVVLFIKKKMNKPFINTQTKNVTCTHSFNYSKKKSCKKIFLRKLLTDNSS